MIKILVLEDDSNLNETVCRHLNARNFQAEGCLNVNDAYNCMYGQHFDLIISDIMLPDTDGFEFAQTVRQMDKNIPIIFMTARDDFSAKEKGYHLGIDDYMIKPIDFDELLLRIEALLRRANIAVNRKLTLGGLVLDEDAVTACLDGEEISMTLREFQILFKLLSYPNKTFTRSQLVEEFTGIESESGLRTVDVFISGLRSKFASCSAFQIKTVRGLGYKAVLYEKG